MSTMTRKALAISAGASMGLGLLMGGPAQAAGYTVGLDLDEGSVYTVLNEDIMTLDLTRPTFVAANTAATNLAIAITNPSSVNLEITFPGIDAGGDDGEIDYDGINAQGDATATTADGAAVGNDDTDTVLTLDFATNDVTTMLIYNIEDNDGTDIFPTSISIRYADGDYDEAGMSFSVVAWLDDNSDVTDVDASTASPQRDITFVDPADVSVIARAERIAADGADYLNENDSANLATRVRFSTPINLDMTNFTNWQFEVLTDDAEVVADADVRPTEDFFDGFDDHDEKGEAILLFGTDTALAAGSEYQLRATYRGQTPVFSAPSFEVVAASDTDMDGVSLDVDGDLTDIQDNGAGDIDVRTGVTSVEFTAQIDDGGTDLEVANQPVTVIVTSNEGTASLVGAGSADEGEAVVYNTLTNSSGQVVFSVTSSAAEADEYTVETYIFDSNGDEIAGDATFTVTYEDAAPATWEANSTVLNGDTLTLSADVEDQFGGAISEDDGDAMSVAIVSTDDTNLEEQAAVVGGSASFTFDNYLTVDGSSDIITMNIYTGAFDDQTAVAGLANITVTLYETVDAAAITLTADEGVAVVQYMDFAEEPDDTPNPGDDATITGTVIDSVGAGVPGAQVTLTAAAEGAIMFENADGDYAVDTMTVSATQAGTFEVDAWTHIADDVVVTITAGGQSATYTVEGELEDAAGGISAQDLLFSWTLPEVIVVNTTYRVDAFVTDVWGNGIPNATVNFNGEAAAQFNTEATVAKTTNADGRATAYLRSLEDVTGLAAVSVDFEDNIEIDADGVDTITDVGDTFSTDDEDTSWDETAATNEIEAEVDFLASAPAAAADTKVNAGSFKGYVAVYAKGHEGQRLSAKIGNDWVVVPALASNFERIVDFTGAGVDIAVRIYIDRVLQDTINLTTK